MYGRELKHPHRYNPKQLWSLIHEHMVLSGLPKTAEMLRTEKDFVPLVPDSLPGPPVYPHTGLVSFPQMNQMLSLCLPGELPPVPPLQSQSCLGWRSTFTSSLPYSSEANPNHCKRVRNHNISKPFICSISAVQGLLRGLQQLQRHQHPAPLRRPLLVSRHKSVGSALPAARSQAGQQALSQQAVNLEAGSREAPCQQQELNCRSG